MKRLIAACTMLVLTGCDGIANNSGVLTKDADVVDIFVLEELSRVYVTHDEKRNVTCWVMSRAGGISCLPNWMLTNKERKLEYKGEVK